MTQILNRSQQQEKDPRNLISNTVTKHYQGEEINVSFRSESRLPNSYKLDKGKIIFEFAIA